MPFFMRPIHPNELRIGVSASEFEKMGLPEAKGIIMPGSTVEAIDDDIIMVALTHKGHRLLGDIVMKEMGIEPIPYESSPYTAIKQQDTDYISLR